MSYFLADFIKKMSNFVDLLTDCFWLLKKSKAFVCKSDSSFKNMLSYPNASQTLRFPLVSKQE